VFGWEGLRRIMEENATELRKLRFLVLSEPKDEQVTIVSVLTDTGKLVLCPVIDPNGHRSIIFRFADRNDDQAYGVKDLSVIEGMKGNVRYVLDDGTHRMGILFRNKGSADG